MDKEIKRERYGYFIYDSRKCTHVWTYPSDKGYNTMDEFEAWASPYRIVHLCNNKQGAEAQFEKFKSEDSSFTTIAYEGDSMW